MSLELFKTAQSTLVDSEQRDILNKNQKKWRNTWSFRPNSKIPFYYGEGLYSGDKIAKKLVHKYYGKKILYVTRTTEANSMISRSKLLKSIKISDSNIVKRSLKSRGNLVILDDDLRIVDHLSDSSNSYGWQSNLLRSQPVKKDIEYVHLKKIIKYCQRAEVTTWFKAHPSFLRYMNNLKHLSLKNSINHDFASVGNLFANLGHLESLKLLYTERKDYLNPFERASQEVQPKIQERKDKKFFSKISKLNQLKKMTFVGYSYTLQQHFEEIEQDLKMFYSKSSKFRLHLKILFQNQRGPGSPGEEITPILKCMLNNAEYLKVDDFAGFAGMKEAPKIREESRRLKRDKKNIVKLVIMRGVNMRAILSWCNSLQALYIKPSHCSLDWKIDLQSDQEIKAFAQLKNVIINFGLLQVQSELLSSSNAEHYAAIPHLKCNLNPEKPEEQTLLSTFLWTILSELKQKCHSLQNLCLFLGINQIKDQHRKILVPLYDEICQFDKLKLFHLRTDTKNFNVVSPSKVLRNKSLDTLNLELNREDLHNLIERKDLPKWDQYLALDTASHIRKLSVNLSLRMNIPLCGSGLLANLEKLENLQVIELVDEANQMMSFDFLYRLLLRLLEKKTMRKILISTMVNNGFYSFPEDGNESTGTFFSEEMNNQLERILKQVYEDLETRVERLKGFELEEIMVGELKGYRFDYLLFNKEMKIVDKLFWDQNEIKEIFKKNKGLRNLYNDIFNLYKYQPSVMKSSPGHLFGSGGRRGLFG